MGRPKGIIFSVRKNIKISEDQNKNWDINTPKLIRELLERKTSEIPKEINDSEVVDKFKRLYEIMNLYLIGKLTPEKISEIPNSILNEIELIEEEFNFD